jgi:heme iron utilization protein
MQTEDREALRSLIQHHRQAALAVPAADPGAAPIMAMIGYVPALNCSALYTLLSGLSAHKRALLASGAGSLLIAEADDGSGDVMTRARVAIETSAKIIARDNPDWSALREHYLTILPDAAQLFALGDFDLIELRPIRGRYIAGFGRALTVTQWPFA